MTFFQNECILNEIFELDGIKLDELNWEDLEICRISRLVELLKKSFLETLQNSQENTCIGVSLTFLLLELPFSFFWSFIF